MYPPVKLSRENVKRSKRNGKGENNKPKLVPALQHAAGEVQVVGRSLLQGDDEVSVASGDVVGVVPLKVESTPICRGKRGQQQEKGKHKGEDAQ
jgi:hypothetical protein